MRDFCRRSAVVLLCAFAALIAVQSAAFAGVRLALVLGNGKYEAVPALDNPSNDAADLAQALRGVGFEVIEQRDATRDAMAKAVREFSERLRGADVALFFYAGHGLQMNGENYLLPVDAKIESPADVRFNTINLSDIQQEMESGGSGRANIIILDACRNNPFAEKLASSGRAILTRGLGRIDATGEGSLIVYSTQPNNVALDGAGRNSPFTAALLKYVAKGARRRAAGDGATPDALGQFFPRRRCVPGGRAGVGADRRRSERARSPGARAASRDRHGPGAAHDRASASSACCHRQRPGRRL
jgi:hypothetical protein